MPLYRFLTFVILAVQAFAASVPSAKLDALIEQARKVWDVPGAAVAIVQGDEVLYLKGFGTRRLGGGEPVTPDTRFAIGSTSKAFTTAAMGILVDSGRMAWDDPVRKHLPFFRLSDPLADANVTMRDIVCHRTGLSRNDLLWFGSPWDREEIIRRIGLVPLTKPFRSAYQYQNIMFLTAGHAVGLISGTSWENFVSKHIFDPLGMRNSDFSANDVVKARDYSEPHARQDGVVKVIPWRNIDNVGPAGSINSSVRDLSAWMRMQLNGGKGILKPATLREMHSPQMVVPLDDNARSLGEGNMRAYGLGWLIQDYRGRHMVAHGGAIDGFRAHVTLFPNEHYGIAILSNLGSVSFPEALRNLISDEVLGLEARDWTAAYRANSAKSEAEARKQETERDNKRHKDTRPSREPAAYAGSYSNPAYGVAKVTVENGLLRLAWSNWKADLEHHHFDVFRSGAKSAPLKGSLFEFRLDDKGDPVGVRFAEQQFRRVR